MAVERFLQPLLHLCFPAVQDTIDWRQRPEFLDTELQALGSDHQQGGRTVDKLVKVRRLDGADQWLYLHIEIQAQPTAQFPWRMWVYYYRLCDKYGPSVISLAILADADPRWRPHTYEAAIAGCGLRFEFPVFKVLDFEDAETRFEQTGNPFALVLAAQQLALATQRDPWARYDGRQGAFTSLGTVTTRNWMGGSVASGNCRHREMGKPPDSKCSKHIPTKAAEGCRTRCLRPACSGTTARQAKTWRSSVFAGSLGFAGDSPSAELVTQPSPVELTQRRQARQEKADSPLRAAA